MLQIVYVTRGDTLKLQPNLSHDIASPNGKNYEIFWDFSSQLVSKQENTVRIIELMEDPVEALDARASLEDNGTALVLTNTNLSDSGIYHLRIVKPLITTAVHMDFHVIVEGNKDRIALHEMNMLLQERLPREKGTRWCTSTIAVNNLLVEA